MTNRDKMLALIASLPNGIITSKQVSQAGLHRSLIQEMVNDGELVQYGRGLYLKDRFKASGSGIGRSMQHTCTAAPGGL